MKKNNELFKKTVMAIFTIEMLAVANIASATIVNPESNYRKGDIHITINNNLDVTYSDVRFKVNNGDDWVDVKDIDHGQNDYIINDYLNENPGIIQAKQSNGQWVAMIMKKSSPDTIVLELNKIEKSSQSSEDSQDGEISGVNNGYYLEAQAAGMKYAITSTVNSGEKESANIIPIAKRWANGWYTHCSGIGAAAAITSCEIGSTPSLTFTGEGGGAGLNVASEGVWSTDLSRNQLWGKHGTFRYSAFLYTSISMKDNNASYDHSHFQGGGYSVGFFGGNARIGGLRP